MMLIQFRLKRHQQELEKRILQEILRFFQTPKYRNILDSRDPSDISDAIKEIIDKIVQRPEFQGKGRNFHFKDQVTRLANELKQDILLLSFTFEYLQEFFEEDIDLAMDNDTYTDFITQFRAYLEADKVTDVNPPELGAIQTAFQDARAARALGFNEFGLGDLVVERLSPTQGAQGVQVQTATYIPIGLMPILKGFGGAKRSNAKYIPRKLKK